MRLAFPALGLLLVFSPAPAAASAGLVLRQEPAVARAAPPDTGAARPAAGGRRVIEAVRVRHGTLTIDGRLNEPAWHHAELATGFVQHRPDAGTPASEATEVRVLYDDDALYVGVRLHDSQPDSIVGQLARRDEALYSDWFFVAIDSYRDRRTAFVFGVNPRGVQRDFIIYDDTRSDPGWDAVWEAAANVDSGGWTAEFRIPFSQLRFSTAVEEVDMALQTASDREEYERSALDASTVVARASGGGLVWGINFERRLARRDEVAYWAPIPGDAAGLVSLYGDLRGLVGLAPPRRLELRPYSLIRLSRAPGAADDPFHRSNDVLGSVGADVKYGVTSDLTLTLTLNPDFGQVEADPSVLNLTAYETFFDEKRPFFLEGAEIFNTGWPQLFYSRRIGREPQGTLPAEAVHADIPESTTILAAAKLTGKTAGGWSVGVLEALTAPERARFVDGDGDRGGTPIEPLTNYAVARVQRNLREGGSAIGTILTTTHRKLDGAASAGSSGTAAAGLDRLHGAAYAGGIDARHRFGADRYEVSGVALASHVRGSTRALARTQRAPGRYFHRPDADHVTYDPDRTSLSGYAARARVAKIGGGHWRWALSAHAFSPGFEVNDLGFHLWPDEIFQHAMIGYDQYRSGRFFRSWRINVGQFTQWTFGGERTDAAVDVFANFTLLNHWGGYVYQMRHPSALSVDALRGGPALHRPARHMGGFNLHTDRRRRVSAQTTVSWDVEDDTGGRVLSGSARLDIRPSTRMDLSLAPRLSVTRNPWQYVTVGTAADSAYYITAQLRRVTTALTARLNYTFSPTLSLQFYAQPFISAGTYSTFAAVADTRAARFDERFDRLTGDRIRYDEATSRYRVNPDGGGQAEFDFADPDFSFKQLRSNAVLRWEFRPGSTVFLVWGADQTAFDPDGSFRLRRDLEGLFSAPGTNALLLKVNYWFSS